MFRVSRAAGGSSVGDRTHCTLSAVHWVCRLMHN